MDLLERLVFAVKQQQYFVIILAIFKLLFFNGVGVKSLPTSQGPFDVPGDVAFGCYRFNGIVLTFDDGPDIYTDQVLDTLTKHNVTATFFLTGKNARRYPDIVRRIYYGGHTIGSHSLSHADLIDAYHEHDHYIKLQRELFETEEIIQNITGERPWLFRPPYGRIKPVIKDMLVSRGYTIVMWNAGCMDWHFTNFTLIMEVIARGMGGSGGIVCFHDVYKHTARNIGRFVRRHQEFIIPIAECLRTH